MEEFSYELPFWRVIHFVWMIAWGLELLMGVKVPNIFQIPCLKKASRQHVVASMDIPLLHDESQLVLSPKANLHTWEEQLGDRLIGENLVQWRSLSDEDASGGEDIFQYPSLQLLEDKQHLGGGGL